MDDEIDELVASSIGKFMEIDLNAVNRSATADDLSSSRLADSPSCIVVDEHDPTMQMQQILKMMGNRDLPEAKPILEINPSHPIVTKLAGVQDEAVIDDMSRLLLDQALLVEGAELKDPAAFVRRLNRALEKSL